MAKNICVLEGYVSKYGLRETQSGEHTTQKFQIRVRRRYGKTEDGKPIYDNIDCTLFRSERFRSGVKEGDRLIVSGPIQTGSYTNRAGQKVYTTELVVDEIDWINNGSSNSNNSTPAPDTTPAPTPEPATPATSSSEESSDDGFETFDSFESEFPGFGGFN